MTNAQVSKRLLCEIHMLECLEWENRIIIDINPLKSSNNRPVPSRFNNTTIVKLGDENDRTKFQFRVLSQSDPYRRASFLIEIRSPEIRFLDAIYHPSIDESGHFCMCASYKPLTTYAEIIDYVIHTIDNIPGGHHVHNNQCFLEYQNDYSAFYRKALEFTLSYERPRY